MKQLHSVRLALTNAQASGGRSLADNKLRKGKVMKRFYFLVLMLVVPVLAMAQAPDSLWGRTYGGNSEDYCYFVGQTSDGGYALIGETRSFGAGSNDYWLVRTDSYGNKLWDRTYGGSDYDRCLDGAQTSDGGYILAGWQGPISSRDFWAVKTDANGTMEWNRRYGGYGGTNEEICFSVQQTTDGGYILAGVCNNDIYAPSGEFWLVKTNADGDNLWTRAFGGSGYDACYSVRQTSDGGYILAGFTASFGAGNRDIWLIKTNSNGDSLWSHTFGGGDEDHCSSVQQTSDGGYILAGQTLSFGAGSYDFWLIKTSANGDSIWSRTFGGISGEMCEFVQQTSDGGYVLIGRTESFSAGNQDVWLLKTDANGDSIWSRTFGGSLDDRGTFVQPTSDGGYILLAQWDNVPYTSGNTCLIKTGPEAPKSAYVSLISSGPPDWGYRLIHVQGNIYQLIFTNICPGTVGSVSGDAAAAGWTVANYPNLVVFTTTTPFTYSCVDTFWLSHPSCSDVVDWIAGDSSGTVDGPLPVELTTFQAFAGDGQVTLRWQTATEQDNDHFVLYKRRAGVSEFQRLANIPGHGTTSEPHDYDYVDSWVQNSVTYEYQISDVDISGRETFYEHIISATPGRDAVPTDYALYQNHPNPFNPTTEIVYDVKEAGQVTLKVFNLLGQEIATLVDAVQSAQRYHVSFDGSTLASGVYLYTIQVNDFYATRKMVLLK